VLISSYVFVANLLSLFVSPLHLSHSFPLKLVNYCDLTLVHREIAPLRYNVHSGSSISSSPRSHLPKQQPLIPSSNTSSRRDLNSQAQHPPKVLLKPASQPAIYGYTPSSWYHFHLRTIVLWALPLLSLCGGYFTWMLACQNGTLESLTLLLDQEKPTFPGTMDLLVMRYIGWERVDKRLAMLVAAWAPVVSGQSLELSLWAIMGMGQFGAFWTLLMMEGLRMGNRRRVASL
jgi:hypothetical protein